MRSGEFLYGTHVGYDNRKKCGMVRGADGAVYKYYLKTHRKVVLDENGYPGFGPERTGRKVKPFNSNEEVVFTIKRNGKGSMIVAFIVSRNDWEAAKKSTTIDKSERAKPAYQAGSAPYRSNCGRSAQF